MFNNVLMSSTMQCICIASTKKTNRLGKNKKKKTNTTLLKKKRSKISIHLMLGAQSIIISSFNLTHLKIRSSLFSWMKELKSDIKKEEKEKKQSTSSDEKKTN